MGIMQYHFVDMYDESEDKFYFDSGTTEAKFGEVIAFDSETNNWYGNHSERGVRTYVILYTLIESCRLNGIDPHKYIPDLVKSLHQYGNGKWKVKKEDPEWEAIYEKRKTYSFTPRQYREKNFPLVTNNL